jgi:hypothetical protein
MCSSVLKILRLIGHVLGGHQSRQGILPILGRKTSNMARAGAILMVSPPFLMVPDENDVFFCPEKFETDRSCFGWTPEQTGNIAYFRWQKQ